MITRGNVLNTEASIDIEPDATTLEDLSRYKNNGTFLGAGEPDWVQLPSGLWVMDFDGANDYVLCGNNVVLNPGTSDFAVEFWANGSGNTSPVSLIGKSDHEASAMTVGWQIGFRLDLNYVSFTHNAAANIVTWANEEDYLDDGLWHHWVFTADRSAGTITLYRDAVPRGTRNPAAFGTNITCGNQFHIACSGHALRHRNFDGLMILIRQHRFNMSNGEILQHYESERYLLGVHD